MTFTVDDHQFMATALELAERGVYSTHPNPRVGCVIVKDGRVVGKGWHEYAGGPHAEINALAAAGEHALAATAYVTLEPCCHFGRTGPCSEALIDAGVSRVVAAMEDPFPSVKGQGLARLRAAGVTVHSGLLRKEATSLNQGYARRLVSGRPFVRCKVAATLDGRTASASGESQWITGEMARRDVQRWRARSSAIMTGIGTVLADDPSLTLRDSAQWLGEYTSPSRRQPLRVIVDSQLRMPPAARMLGLEGRTLVFTCCSDAQKRDALSRAGADVIVSTGKPRVDLNEVLDYLGQQEVNELLVEAGPTLSGAMVDAGLVDELLLYLAPQFLGSQAKGMFQMPAVNRLSERVNVEINSIRAIGQDLRLTARPMRKKTASGG